MGLTGTLLGFTEEAGHWEFSGRGTVGRDDGESDRNGPRQPLPRQEPRGVQRRRPCVSRIFSSQDLGTAVSTNTRREVPFNQPTRRRRNHSRVLPYPGVLPVDFSSHPTGDPRSRETENESQEL